MIALRQQASIADSKQVFEVILYRYLKFKEGRTKEDYKRYLKAFFAWFEDKGYNQIDIMVCNSYKLYLMAKEYKPNTINTYLAALRDFLSWCAEAGYIESNPAKNIKSVKIKDTNDIKKARALSNQEVRDMLIVTHKRSLKAFSERLYLLLIFNLGLRVSEATKVKVQDINLEDQTILINGKGSKQRTLGTNEVLTREIKEYIGQWNGQLSGEDYLIQTFKGNGSKKNTKPAGRSWGNRLIKAIAKLARVDLEGVSTHSGRVTAINFLLDSEISLRDAANFAGHSNVDTTRMYDRKNQDKVIQTCNIISFTDKE